MNNQQITASDLFPLIGRQTIEINLLREKIEQLQAMLQQAQNGIIEAQEVAKKLHHQIQKSAMENNGAEVKQLENEPGYSTR